AGCGEDRFSDVAVRCADALRDRVASEPAGLPAGAGPIWTAGFCFDPKGGSESKWSSLPPALLVMPELALVRSGEEAYLTAAVMLEREGDPEAAIERFRGRLARLAAA